MSDDNGYISLFGFFEIKGVQETCTPFCVDNEPIGYDGVNLRSIDAKIQKGKDMYILSTKSDFDSAHFLKDYDGKCANIHGHRWTVAIEAKGEKLKETGSERGMVTDFSELKKSLKKLTKMLDHSLLIEEGSLKPATMEAMREEGFRIMEFPFRPTAENLAKYFYDNMTEEGYSVVKTTVYETPNNAATYMM